MSRFVKKLVRRNTTSADNRLSSHSHSHSISHSSASGDDAAKDVIEKEIYSFCDAAKWNREGDEYLHLPTIVDTAENSPAAARHAARIVRRILSKSLTAAGASHPNKPYNAIMVMRILTSNPGQTFTVGYDDKFASTVKKVLKDNGDVMVQHILRDTLYWMERDVLGADKNVKILVEVWEKEKKNNATRPMPQPNYTTHPRHQRTQSTPVATIANLQPPPFSATLPPVPATALPPPVPVHPPPSAATALPKPSGPITLPPPDDLAARISEATETTKLLQQFIQSTPAAQFHTSELLLEFSARCQAAAQDLQSYIHATNPEPPDEQTVLVLIETVEEIAVALSRYNRAAVTARKICSVSTEEDDGDKGNGVGGVDSGNGGDPGVGPSGQGHHEFDIANAYRAEHANVITIGNGNANRNGSGSGNGYQPVNAPSFTRSVPVSGPYLLPLERSASSANRARQPYQQQQQSQQQQQQQFQAQSSDHSLHPQGYTSYDQESFYSNSQPDISTTPAPPSAPPVPQYYRQQQEEQQRQQQQQQQQQQHDISSITAHSTLHERSMSDTPPTTATGGQSTSTNPFRRSTPMDSSTSLSRLAPPTGESTAGTSGLYTPSSMIVNLHENPSYGMIPPPLVPSSSRLASREHDRTATYGREGGVGEVSDRVAHTHISPTVTTATATTAATAGGDTVGNITVASSTADDPEAELEWFYKRYSGDDDSSSEDSVVLGSPTTNGEHTIASAVHSPPLSNDGRGGFGVPGPGVRGHTRNRMGSGGSISVNVGGVDMPADMAARLLGTKNQRGGVVFKRDDEELDEQGDQYNFDHDDDHEHEEEYMDEQHAQHGNSFPTQNRAGQDYNSNNTNPFLRNAAQARQQQLFGPLNSNPYRASTDGKDATTATAAPAAAKKTLSPSPSVSSPLQRSQSRRIRPRAQPLNLPKPRLASQEIEGSDGTVPFSDSSHSSSHSEIFSPDAGRNGFQPLSGKARTANGRYHPGSHDHNDEDTDSESERRQQEKRWQDTAWDGSPQRRQSGDSDRGLFDDSYSEWVARQQYSKGRNGLQQYQYQQQQQQQQQMQIQMQAQAQAAAALAARRAEISAASGEGIGRNGSFRHKAMGMNPFSRKASNKGRA